MCYMCRSESFNLGVYVIVIVYTNRCIDEDSCMYNMQGRTCVLLKQT